MSIRKAFSIIITFALLLFFSGSALAYSLTCGPSKGCVTSGFEDGPLFDESNIYPGWSIAKTVSVKNEYEGIRKFAIMATSEISENENVFMFEGIDLADVLNFSVKEKDTNKTVYPLKGPSVKLNTFISGGYITLSEIGPGESQDFIFEVSMDTRAGNEFQNRNTYFNLSLGFDEAEVIIPEDPENEGDDDNDDDEDDEDSEDSEGLTTQVAGASTTTLISQLSASEPAVQEPEDTNRIELASQPQVAGAATCTDPWWWFFVFILQALVHLALSLWVKKYPLVHVAVALPFMFVFWKYFCPVWDVWISALIGLAFYAWTFYQSRKSERYIKLS